MTWATRERRGTFRPPNGSTGKGWHPPQDERAGAERVFEVEPGRYEVVLLFSETNANFGGKGKRLFDIEVNDKQVAEKVDVFAEAGGLAKPWQFRKVVTVTGRKLDITLQANPTGPALKGIEIRGLAPR